MTFSLAGYYQIGNFVPSPQHHRRLIPHGPQHSTAPPPRTAMASSSTYLMLASARAPLAPLIRPPLMALVARTAAASITSGARASVPLFVNAAACRPGVRRHGWAQFCRDSSLKGPPGADSPAQEQEDMKKSEAVSEAAARIAGGSGGRFSDWSTSVLIFGIWAGLMYYVFLLAPNQTPVRDNCLPACFVLCCCECDFEFPC